MKKILIVGAGMTGITLAEQLAVKNQVVVIDKRDHIGGNCYDYQDENQILIHKYGPHIFHTNSQRVWRYLSRFTQWKSYQHQVLAMVDGRLVPIPFNLNSIELCFGKKKQQLIKEKLLEKYKMNARIPILKLLKTNDRVLKELAVYVYEKIFINYNLTQWGLTPEEIDSSISARVPIVVSRSNNYFPDKHQAMPLAGYTRMLEKMLESDNIKLKLKTSYQQLENLTQYDLVFYTGPIDEFFRYKFGKLDYRRLKIKFKTYDTSDYQPTAVVNYPNKKEFTRISEYRKFYPERDYPQKTVVSTEYPGAKGFLGMPTIDSINKQRFARYEQEASKLKTVIFAGRLGQYRYFDMDDTILNALDLAEDYLE